MIGLARADAAAPSQPKPLADPILVAITTIRCAQEIAPASLHL
jgi:hypothetical protein